MGLAPPNIERPAASWFTAWRKRLRGRGMGVLVAVLVGGIAVVLVLFLGEPIRMDVADILARSSLEKGKSPSVVVVEIDEGTLNALAGDYGRMNEWPREFYGMVLDVLRKAGARRIAFDILFDAPSPIDPGSDEVFADTAKQVPDTILAANFIEGDVVKKPLPEAERLRLAVPVTGELPRDAAPEFETVITAFEELLKGAVDIGVVRQETDPDGVVRSIRPFYRHGGEVFAALGLSALRSQLWRDVDASGPALTGGDGDDIRLPIDDDGMLHLRFLGGRDRYVGPSFGQVLYAGFQMEEGKPLPAEMADAFRDKVVFIGASASGLYDLKVTPVSRWLPGVYLSATAAEDLLLGRWLVSVPQWLVLALAIALAAAGGLAVRMKRWYLGVGVTVALAVIICLAAILVFSRDLWLDPVIPIISLWGGFTAAGVHRYLTEDYYKRKIRSAWGRYLSPEVIDDLSKRDFEVEGLERGIRKELTVLFSDIIGFTSMSEHLEPEEVVSQLNDYLGVMSDVIRRRRGTLDKYIGDAIMAFWGEPLEDAEHAKHAVLAAVEMTEALADLQERWRKEGKKPFAIGIGINTGHVVVGHFGGAHRNYTVIGDEVNIASRLEGLTRQYETDIIVSAATALKVKDIVGLEHIGEVQVKNREKPVDIYAVKGRKHDADTR